MTPGSQPFNPRALKKFDLNHMTDNMTCLILGKRDTGKSTLIMDLLNKELSHIPFGLLISGSEMANEEFSNVLPDTFIFDELRTDKLEELMKRQIILKKLYGGKSSEAQPDSIKAFVILDDVTSDKNFANSNIMRKLFMLGRHYNICVIVTVHEVKGALPKGIRRNADFVFLLRDHSAETKADVYQTWGGPVTEEEFREAFNYATNGYSALVINNRTRSTSPYDVLTWYVADLIDPTRFKVCHPFVWSYHNMIYDKDWHFKEMGIDPNAVLRKAG